MTSKTNFYNLASRVEDADRGTFNCPICGVGAPHWHTPNEIKFRPDQLRFRLERLAEYLRPPGPHQVGGGNFYSAMQSVYDTHYGPDSEATLRRELQTVVAELQVLASLRALSAMENTK